MASPPLALGMLSPWVAALGAALAAPDVEAFLASSACGAALLDLGAGAGRHEQLLGSSAPLQQLFGGSTVCALGVEQDARRARELDQLGQCLTRKGQPTLFLTRPAWSADAEPDEPGEVLELLAEPGGVTANDVLRAIPAPGADAAEPLVDGPAQAAAQRAEAVEDVEEQAEAIADANADAPAATAGWQPPVWPQEPKIEAPLFLAVTSGDGAEYAARRQAVRDAWKAHLEDPNHPGRRAVLKFFTGRPAHGLEPDVVPLGMQDTYQNLTLKTAKMLSWIQQNVDAPWVVKSDDDVFLRTDRLFRLLKTERQNTLMGHVIEGSAPVRKAESNAFVSMHAYSGARYPPYASGCLYVMSKDVVGKLVHEAASPGMPWLTAEDVQVGLWASRAGVELENESRILALGKTDRYQVCSEDALAIHYVAPDEMRAMAANLANRQPVCGARRDVRERHRPPHVPAGLPGWSLLQRASRPTRVPGGAPDTSAFDALTADARPTHKWEPRTVQYADGVPVWLVVGWGRSGTTMTQDLLASDRDTFTLFEPCHYGSSGSDQYRGETLNADNVADLCPQLLRDAANCEFKHMQLHYSQKGSARGSVARDRQYLSAEQSRSEMTNLCLDAKRRVIKVVHTDAPALRERDLAWLLNSVATIKVVAVVRDPRAVLLSRRATHRVDPGSWSETDGPMLGQMCSQLAEVPAWSRNRQDRVYDLEYESIVKDPEASVSGLYSFLGASPASALRWVQTNMGVRHCSGSYNRGAYGTCRSSGQEQQELERWKSLPGRDLKTADAMCSVAFQAFNYPLAGKLADKKEATQLEDAANIFDSLDYLADSYGSAMRMAREPHSAALHGDAASHSHLAEALREVEQQSAEPPRPRKARGFLGKLMDDLHGAEPAPAQHTQPAHPGTRRRAPAAAAAADYVEDAPTAPADAAGASEDAPALAADASSDSTEATAAPADDAADYVADTPTAVPADTSGSSDDTPPAAPAADTAGDSPAAAPVADAADSEAVPTVASADDAADYVADAPAAPAPAADTSASSADAAVDALTFTSTPAPADDTPDALTFTSTPAPADDTLDALTFTSTPAPDAAEDYVTDAPEPPVGRVLPKPTTVAAPAQHLGGLSHLLSDLKRRRVVALQDEELGGVASLAAEVGEYVRMLRAHARGPVAVRLALDGAGHEVLSALARRGLLCAATAGPDALLVPKALRGQQYDLNAALQRYEAGACARATQLIELDPAPATTASC